MFKVKNLEQRIGIKPYDYFEYESLQNKHLQNKQSTFNKVACFICGPISYMNYSKKSTPSRNSGITLVVIKCFYNLICFFKNCLFFCLNKTYAYKLLKEKDFSNGSFLTSDIALPIILGFFERELYLFNNERLSFEFKNINDAKRALDYIKSIIIISKLNFIFSVCVYRKATFSFIDSYSTPLVINNRWVASPSKVIVPLFLPLVLLSIVTLRATNRFVDLSVSLLETTAVIYKVYQGLEECFALYKQKPKQSLTNATFYSAYLALILFKLYNVINFKSYTFFSGSSNTDHITEVNCKRVDPNSLSDKLEERIKDSRLEPDCPTHKAQLINPKYNFEIIDEKDVDEFTGQSQIITRISPLNFEASELKRECRKYAFEWHPDKASKDNEVAVRILNACEYMKRGLIKLSERKA